MLVLLLLVIAFVEASPCLPLAVAPVSSNPPFNLSETQLMRSYFMRNINYMGTGGVVAAPDNDVGPGGSYEFNWMRDAGLSMRAVLNNFYDESLLRAYVGWVSRAQTQRDPNDQSVLTEPKFNLPNGTVFSGGWCRPQNDGPSIRATTLMQFGTRLLRDNANVPYVRGAVYKAVSTDLDWVAANGWASSTCDLWEELRVADGDIFWNRMAHYKALSEGAAFANLMGDSARSQTYAAAAAKVNATLADHWNGEYVFEARDRPLDSAVVAAFNNHYTQDSIFKPLSNYAAATFAALSNDFCSEYAINQKDTAQGIPGILWGRYPNDRYFGGNPWILLSANGASLLYRAAKQALSGDNYHAWDNVIDFNAGTDPLKIAEKLRAAGDGIMLRIKYHVMGDGFHLNEQLDRNSGYEISAHDLTWSYSAVFNALRHRADVAL